MFKWLRDLFSKDFSYRAESGVKINVTELGAWPNTRVRMSVDFDDPQTKEIMRKELEKWAQYEIKDGRLVKKE